MLKKFYMSDENLKSLERYDHLIFLKLDKVGLLPGTIL